jgi:hypothetical protein
MVGIIKEIAPVRTAQTDEELGVNFFNQNYFPYLLYRNSGLEFYASLGQRSLLRQVFTTNPFTLYSNYQTLKSRIRGRGGLVGNYAGEGITLGGVYLISPLHGIVFEYQEVTGNPMPVVEIQRAVNQYFLQYPPA